MAPSSTPSAGGNSLGESACTNLGVWPGVIGGVDVGKGGGVSGTGVGGNGGLKGVSLLPIESARRREISSRRISAYHKYLGLKSGGSVSNL